MQSTQPKKKKAERRDSGSIHLVCGPMFSGKTSELLRLAKRRVLAGQHCLLVRYASDTRYSETHIASHDGRAARADVSVHALSELGDTYTEYDAICIDEGQFYPDLVKFCARAAAAGKYVAIAALDGRFDRAPFPQVAALFPLCDSVTKLLAICAQCQRDAPFSRRVDSELEDEVDVGGDAKYVAVCRTCYELPFEQWNGVRSPEFRDSLERTQLLGGVLPQSEQKSQ